VCGGRTEERARDTESEIHTAWTEPKATRMEGGFTFIALPLGLMFFLSGLIINVFQLLATLFVLPLSRRIFRIVNMVMMEALWSELIWLVDWWAGVQVRVYADLSTWNHMGKEHALVISNHRSAIDWLVGWIMAQVSPSLSCLSLPLHEFAS
jgi:lysophosphatidic acid acyltransferase/lysophosphatidylinositol acyltransferase